MYDSNFVSYAEFPTDCGNWNGGPMQVDCFTTIWEEVGCSVNATGFITNRTPTGRMQFGNNIKQVLFLHFLRFSISRVFVSGSSWLL